MECSISRTFLNHFNIRNFSAINLAEEGGFLRMFVEIGSGRVLYTSVAGF